MPDLKISQLPVATTPLAGTELVPIVQGGTTDQTTVQAILTGTVPSGTANGVMYLNGSKVATTGSALTFTGTRFGIGETSPVAALTVKSGNGDQASFNNAGERFTQLTLLNNGTSKGSLWVDNTNSLFELYGYSGMSLTFSANGSEGMRLTSTGLGIGTSSPGTKLEVTTSATNTNVASFYNTDTADGNGVYIKAGGVNAGKYALYIENGSGTAILNLLASGNLGIGTSSPATKLHVVGSTYRQNDATGSFGFTLNTTSATTTLATLFGGSSFAIQTAGSGTNQLLLDSSGNLGLGVTPSAWDATGAGGPVLQIKRGLLFGSDTEARLIHNAYYGTGDFRYIASSVAATNYQQQSGQHRWFTAPSGTAGNAISFTQALTLDANRNLLLNGTAAPASGVGTFAMFNGTAPTGSVTDGCVLYTEDVSSSSELKVRDEAGNVTTLSPHNFELIPEGPSEDMAWSYYSERDGKRINVDMLKAIRLLEKLSGEQLVYKA